MECDITKPVLLKTGYLDAAYSARGFFLSWVWCILKCRDELVNEKIKKNWHLVELYERPSAYDTSNVTLQDLTTRPV